MTDDEQYSKPLMAGAYVVAAVANWWAFDAGGLEMIDQLKDPNRGISQVVLTRPGYDSGPITTLASGHAMLAEHWAKVT